MSFDDAVNMVHVITSSHESDRAYGPRVGAACDKVAAKFGVDPGQLYDCVVLGERSGKGDNVTAQD